MGFDHPTPDFAQPETRSASELHRHQNLQRIIHVSVTVEINVTHIGILCTGLSRRKIPCCYVTVELSKQEVLGKDN
jgi:hypothetical protein